MTSSYSFFHISEPTHISTHFDFTSAFQASNLSRPPHHYPASQLMCLDANIALQAYNSSNSIRSYSYSKCTHSFMYVKSYPPTATTESN